MVFHGARTPEGDALRGRPRSGAAPGTRPPDQRVVTPLNVGGHPCEEPLARSRSRPLSAVALLAAGCGGGGSEDAATSAAAGKTAATSRRGLQPREPARSRQQQRDLWRQRHRRHLLPSSSSSTRTPPRRERDRRGDRDERQQGLDGQAKRGLKFNDGTEVTAKNFVDAWNYAATPRTPRGWLLLDADRGLRHAVNGSRRPGAGAGKAKADKMAGLEVVDDSTSRSRPRRRSRPAAPLGYSAFAPLPDVSSTTPRPSVTSRSATARSSSTRGPKRPSCCRIR